MKYLLAAACFFSLATPALAADSKWEMTIVTTDEDGKPSEMKMTQCMSREQAEAQTGMAAYGKDSSYETNDGDCHVKGSTVGTTMTMKSVCKSGEITEMTSTSTADGITTVTKNTVDGKTSTMKMTGKRLGDC